MGGVMEDSIMCVLSFNLYLFSCILTHCPKRLTMQSIFLSLLISRAISVAHFPKAPSLFCQLTQFYHQ